MAAHDGHEFGPVGRSALAEPVRILQTVSQLEDIQNIRTERLSPQSGRVSKNDLPSGDVNNPEFAGTALDAGAAKHGVQVHLRGVVDTASAKVPARLRKMLMSTNPIGSMFSLVRHSEWSIKRTRGSTMLERWLGTMLLYWSGSSSE
jgi:hypothetical protein